ncbi:hypothetical protein SAMN04488028_101176 [Reichenbachiella agariperforans]|uniref:Uncharacterized protein n=1 Tax=Reichenbachiella agariperforans TaxID=156994 RepID=A0A1M6JFN4_REIAG|nr:hypothetical protein SAMN04488028_101176 [Reichenbachiella agariperforans]
MKYISSMYVIILYNTAVYIVFSINLRLKVIQLTLILTLDNKQKTEWIHPYDLKICRSPLAFTKVSIKSTYPKPTPPYLYHFIF